ncbi:MAG: cyclic nucleotide-binding domain-containing protein [Deltaproteobacteria bacterium]|nr:cyclic nucleotide-binding domain-containing protein [Deltaproteobacteria bacterium]
MTTSNVAGVVRSSPLFAGLELSHLTEIERLGRTLTYRPGDAVFFLGEPATSLLLIESGQVALRLPIVARGDPTEITLEEKGPGEVLAWSSLVPPHRLTLNAQAVTDVTLVAIDRAALEEVFKDRPSLHLVTVSNLCRVIGSRVARLEAMLIRELNRRMADLTTGAP